MRRALLVRTNMVVDTVWQLTYLYRGLELEP